MDPVTSYSQNELLLPALGLLEQAPSGLTTTALIALLTDLMAPDGRDLEPYNRRRDTIFSQTVRNLTGSHKRLEQMGLATKATPRGPYLITAAGMARLATERGQLAQRPDAHRELGLTTGTRFADYQEVPIPRRAPVEPFAVDPDIVDRGTRGHAETQNALSRWVLARGWRPERWAGGVAPFDLAWRVGDALFVAEVKSTTARNEIRQLRLGLGQVLHYRHQLRQVAPTIVAVLAVEREPGDRGWVDLCRSHGVALVWPDEFDRLL
jgi:hypothetical protein